MNQTIVIYESKYGSTRRYAEWIAGALSCPVLEKRSVHPASLAEYDTIIYGGGLYAGGVSGISLLTKNYDSIKEKNLVLFTCGVADPKDKNNVSHIREGLSKVLTPDMMNRIQIFHLRGGIDYSRLNFVHKSMMAMLHKVMVSKDPSELTEEDRMMLDTYGKKVDFCDQNSIDPLVRYVCALNA